MRLVLDSLVALMLAGVLAGIVLFDRQTDAREVAIEQTRDALAEITQEIRMQAALGKTELTTQGHPKVVDPEWFEAGVPSNTLFADAALPWLEVASRRDRDLTHPTVRAVDDASHATFWYNPYNGLVRARVPDGLSDAAALTLYNQVNGTTIDTLFGPIEERP